MRKEESGMLLVDIILALALAAVFIAVISESTLSARSIFIRSKDKAALLTLFENTMNSGMSPYVSTSTLFFSSKMYGNDRIETDIEGLSLVKVSANDALNTSDFSGMPLCSVDFVNHSVVGSYAWVGKDRLTIHVTAIPLPISPTLLLTDFQVRNGIVYASANSSVQADPDLLVINIKDRAHVQLLSLLNTGPGISAFNLVHNRVFAAAASTASQLHVVRYDTLATPIIEKKFTLPLPLASSSPTKGSAIFYYKNKVFLGTEKWDGDEFNVIDISQPANPKKIGGFEINSKVNDIWARGNTAYVADSDDKQFRILNITDVTQPQLQSVFLPSGGSRQEGKDISIFEDNVYFGRTSGGFDISTDHEFFAMSTSSLFQNSASAYASLNIAGGLYGMIQDRYHIYLATRETGKEFKVIDPSAFGTPHTPVVLTYPIPVTPQKITCDGDHVYILSATVPVIYDIYFN